MRLIRKRSSNDGRRSEELPVDVPFPFEAKRSWPDLLSEMQASANAAASAAPAADAGAINDDDCDVIAEGRVQVPVCGGGLVAPDAAAAGPNAAAAEPEGDEQQQAQYQQPEVPQQQDVTESDVLVAQLHRSLSLEETRAILSRLL